MWINNILVTMPLIRAEKMADGGGMINKGILNSLQIPSQMKMVETKNTKNTMTVKNWGILLQNGPVKALFDGSTDISPYLNGKIRKHFRSHHLKCSRSGKIHF